MASCGTERSIGAWPRRRDTRSHPLLCRSMSGCAPALLHHLVRKCLLGFGWRVVEHRNGRPEIRSHELDPTRRGRRPKPDHLVFNPKVLDSTKIAPKVLITASKDPSLNLSAVASPSCKSMCKGGWRQAEIGVLHGLFTLYEHIGRLDE